MERAEVDLAVEWAAREGWNPGLADAAAFHAADPEGFLVSEDSAGEPVACISAVRHGDGLGFVGFYIVAPERRGEGLGIAIWRAGMARLEGRLVGLDGVVDQQDAYARSGFSLAWRNLRYGADTPRPVDVPGGAAAVVEAATLPFPALAAYDAELAAGPREPFLRPWLTLPGHVALAAVRDGVPAGLGVVRPCRDGAKIGPLFADDAPTARALFAALAARAPAGPLHLDVPEPNAEAAALAREAGMAPVFETARMYTGATAGDPARARVRDHELRAGLTRSVVGAAGLVAALLAVAVLADDAEVRVEVDVDLAAVGTRDLDLVGALLVADLGLGHSSAAGLLERDRLGPVQRRPGDRRVARVVVAAAGGAGDRRSADADGDDRCGGDRDGLVLAPHGVPPPRVGLVNLDRDATAAT